ncbi:MAG: hypothetical protein PHF84_05710 [bacterium]|nr:hypothetical protein [bacterium]
MRFIIIILSILLGVSNLFPYAIQITQSLEGGWTLLDENSEPFVVEGVCYSPTPIGQTVWEYNLGGDLNSPWLVDADLMQAMGVNVIRIYNKGTETGMEEFTRFIRQMYKLYSIYTVFPLPLNMQGANFASEEYKARAKKEILETVEQYKDTKGILVWLLGNEIDYSFFDDKAFWDTKELRDLTPFQRAKARARMVFEFLNEISEEIKKIDGDHPVGVSLGKTDFFSLIKETLPGVDFIGLNYYQGRNFSSVWSLIRKQDKPILITEFGYDAYNTKKMKEDEETQAQFIVSLWNDINKQVIGRNTGSLCLGGCLFEWTDEWWKFEYGDPRIHEPEGTWANTAWFDYDPANPNNVQEEWFGILRISTNTNFGTINQRIPRKAYHKLKDLWNPKVE